MEYLVERVCRNRTAVRQVITVATTTVCRTWTRGPGLAFQFYLFCHVILFVRTPTKASAAPPWVPVPIVATTAQEHAVALRAAVSHAAVPVLATFLAVEGFVDELVIPAADGSAARGSVPSFRTPERAVAALAHAVRYGTWLTGPAGTVPDLPGIDTAAARALLAGLRRPDDPARALTDACHDAIGLHFLPNRAWKTGFQYTPTLPSSHGSHPARPARPPLHRD
jgi:hypothetical protein